jgi:hypothetical protein
MNVTELYKTLRETASKKVKGGRTGDVDLLLFNSVPVKELQEEVKGTDFGVGGGAWTLVREIILSAFL